MNSAQEKLAQRARITALKDAGFSVSDIATQLGISKPTVRRWVQRWEEYGNLLDRPRSGAPRKTSREDQRRIVDAVENDPFTNTVAVRESLHLNVSADTIRRRLHEAGFHHRSPAKKGRLEERHREARLQFAQQHINHDLAYWARVIFSDEKTFSSSTHGRLHCWRVNNTRYDARNIYETTRSGHVTANVWGWMHLHGIGELAEIHGRFTAEQYMEILEEVMLPSVRALALPYPEQIIFMQDNSPIHTARVVRTWFEEQRGVELLYWPSKGCDLNPIENVWGNIVNSWEPGRERTSRQLIDHTMAEWEMFRRNDHIIENLVASMPHRLQEVITQNGGWTHY